MPRNVIIVWNKDETFAYASRGATKKFMKRINEFMGTSLKTPEDVAQKAEEDLNGSWWFDRDSDGLHAALTKGEEQLELWTGEEGTIGAYIGFDSGGRCSYVVPWNEGDEVEGDVLKMFRTRGHKMNEHVQGEDEQ